MTGMDFEQDAFLADAPDLIDPVRISAFIASLEPPKDAFLEELRLRAAKDGVPVVRPETESLLTFFVDLLRPLRILEIGCAVGYSAIAMAKHMPEGGRIDTIENHPPRIEEAKKNLSASGFGDRIRLLEGDASEILKRLEGPYDLVFMDAAKAQYVRWLPAVLKLMNEGSVLIADNVLQEGDVLQSRYAVTRRDRTIHRRMREYLYTIKNTDGLSSAVLPLGDGVAVTLKKHEGE